MDTIVIIVIVIITTLPLYYLLYRYKKYKREKDIDKLTQEVVNIISKEKKRLNSDIHKEIEELVEEFKEDLHK
ncbi:sigma factor regulator [Aerococcus phage vB_AviM_AVP]|nr:sigma factor regulator [Aerococcus phage vB_AviM_AVP]